MDPARDDHGPGTYVCPAVDGMKPGAFDLRRLAIEPGAANATVTAVFERAVERVPVRFGEDQRTREVFFPVVDVYIRVPGGGRHQQVLPGRRVVPVGGWDRAVVVSAVGEVLQAHYRAVARDLADDICFATQVRAVGASVVATVPSRCMPGDLEDSAFLVLVTGLGAGVGFQGTVRADAEERERTDSLVREVQEQPGLCGGWEGTAQSPCWCGGCRRCGSHPFVLDAIVPAGMSQEDLLSDYDERTRRFARLPFVSAAAERAAEPAPAARAPRLPVLSVRGRQVSIRPQPGASYPSGTIGAIICPGERPGGTAVVTGEAGGYLVLEKVQDDSPVCEGAEVEF